MTAPSLAAPARPRASAAPLVFTATIFLSAALLFFVQPLFARIVLPQIGGAPAVWTTAMLFFQSVLIAGYLYAHWLTRHVPPRAQLALHLALWAAALLFLPLAIPAGWQHDPAGAAAWQTLTLFAAGVGLPFAVLSANAPLLQSWYARSGGPSADDPYFLYGASNLGSLLALLAFPLVAEPLFGADEIGLGWGAGFVLLGAALLASGLTVWRAPALARAQAAAPGNAPAAPVTARRIARWLLLAFVPSSLMLAVTSKVSTDIGAMPLVWVVPLALYLLSFVLTFTNRPLLGPRLLRACMFAALAGLGVVFTGIIGFHLSLWGAAGLVVAFFGVALYAHRLLYEARPHGGQLTLFYLVMSVGGALGGLFNSILAPALFDGLYEGGLTTLVAVTLVLSGRLRLSPRDAAVAGGAGLLAALPVWAVVQAGITGDTLAVALVGLIATLALALRRSLPRAALAAVTLMLAGSAAIPDGALFRDRSFFGAHVVHDVAGLRVYTNGTTIHGAQRLEDFDGARPEPLLYYHPEAPMAQVFASDVGARAKTVGVVGLGVGSLACYARPGQNWAFYEIDPVVDRVARNPEWFTFLSDCTPEAPTHMGDARVVLAAQEGVEYDILVIDAYSSDAVPVHLTTTEAIELYLKRLAPGGVLIYHISNRYYAIQRPLGRSAAALGLEARLQHYAGDVERDIANSHSRVVMIARDASDFGALEGDARWSALGSDGGRLWTDDYANLLSILE
jgi:SAM-dependent methyltransferase